MLLNSLAWQALESSRQFQHLSTLQRTVLYRICWTVHIDCLRNSSSRSKHELESSQAHQQLFPGVTSGMQRMAFSQAWIVHCDGCLVWAFSAVPTWAGSLPVSKHERRVLEYIEINWNYIVVFQSSSWTLHLSPTTDPSRLLGMCHLSHTCQAKTTCFFKPLLSRGSCRCICHRALLVHVCAVHVLRSLQLLLPLADLFGSQSSHWSPSSAFIGFHKFAPWCSMSNFLVHVASSWIPGKCRWSVPSDESYILRFRKRKHVAKCNPQLNNRSFAWSGASLLTRARSFGGRARWPAAGSARHGPHSNWVVEG